MLTPQQSETRKESCNMKTIFTTIITLVLGISGLIFFFGDRESIIQLILSKPIGLMMLYVSYKLFKRLESEIQSNISNDN